MTARAFRTYLEPDLAQHVEATAARENRSESAVIADAVRLRVAAVSESALKAEEETLRRMIARIERRLDKIVWENAQLKEIVLLFVRIWFEYTPQLDPQFEESAAASAEARFGRFVDFLSTELRAGRTLADIAGLIGLTDVLHKHADAEASI